MLATAPTVSDRTQGRCSGSPHQGAAGALAGRLDVCVPVTGLRVFVGDLDDWQLSAMIEDGRLSWAINVASRLDGPRELRVPLICVRDLIAGAARDYTASELAILLFGAGDEPIRARRLYRVLAIKHSHFYALVRRGQLAILNARQVRSGANNGALIARAAVIEFLQKRRVL